MSNRLPVEDRQKAPRPAILLVSVSCVVVYAV